ncbi:hypothetical protein HA466_0202040 [Hirschfeldia incana]|nr:hypothetical protein HA466_0202040 [Hirschfeldia incana]
MLSGGKESGVEGDCSKSGGLCGGGNTVPGQVPEVAVLVGDVSDLMKTVESLFNTWLSLFMRSSTWGRRGTVFLFLRWGVCGPFMSFVCLGFMYWACGVSSKCL